MQCEYIRTEEVPREGLTATLFYHDRGLVRPDQTAPKKWTITATGEQGRADVDPVSVAVGSALKVTWPGERFDANGNCPPVSG